MCFDDGVIRHGHPGVWLCANASEETREANCATWSWCYLRCAAALNGPSQRSIHSKDSSRLHRKHGRAALEKENIFLGWHGVYWHLLLVSILWALLISTMFNCLFFSTHNILSGRNYLYWNVPRLKTSYLCSIWVRCQQSLCINFYKHPLHWRRVKLKWAPGWSCTLTCRQNDFSFLNNRRQQPRDIWRKRRLCRPGEDLV